jgi:hypothetical protein
MLLKGRLVALGALLGMSLTATLSASGHARGQDAAAVIEAGVAAWEVGGCRSCHGAFAEGGEGGEQPAGPNLRRTRLDRDQLVETISCGRPGTQMPALLEGAYTEVACYGMPVGEVPAGTTQRDALTQGQVEALADFLIAHIAGKRAVTREECGWFYRDPNHAACAEFR